MNLNHHTQPQNATWWSWDSANLHLRLLSVLSCTEQPLATPGRRTKAIENSGQEPKTGLWFGKVKIKTLPGHILKYLPTNMLNLELTKK